MFLITCNNGRAEKSKVLVAVQIPIHFDRNLCKKVQSMIKTSGLDYLVMNRKFCHSMCLSMLSFTNFNVYLFQVSDSSRFKVKT